MTVKGVIVVILSVGLLAIKATNAQQSTVTQTVTQLQTTTTTVIKPTYALCASLVNATSACRRRKQYWIDTPVIIALDDDVDERLSQYLNPANVFIKVEPTAVPTQSRTNLEGINNVNGVVGTSNNLAALHVLQPSIYPSHFYYSRVADPFFLGALGSFINSVRRATRTVSTTVTSTATSSVILTLTTATKPFIIQNCVPGSLPFPNC